jgi:predicted ATPase/class 3 adenylate cyclase
MGDVPRWLRELGLHEYATLFDEHKIDFEVLEELNESDLKDLDIPLGHRKKLLKAIASLGASDGAPDLEDGVLAGAQAGVLSEAERRQVTIMFCDLVGSTELSGRLDPEDLRALMADYQNACRKAIARYEGFVARYMGDGVLAYFGYPKSHEDDAERAVLAGLALFDFILALNEAAGEDRHSKLAVRIGIATGLVVVGDLIGEGASQESPVIGETPNIAARLQNLAEPDTIVIAQSTHQLIGQSFEYRALGEKSLKGVGKPVHAWEVIGERSVESRFEAARNTGLTPLVGREEEIGLLVGRWKRAKEGDGQVVLVSGEAGIGKSRLTEEIRRSIAADPHIRVGYQCLAHYQNSAFHPVIAQLERAAGISHRHSAMEKLDLLESLLRRSEELDIGDVSLIADLLSVPSGDRYPDAPSEPEQRKAKTLSALIRQLELLTAGNPVLWVFEDVHWIDPSTLELLERLVERVNDLPVLIIATCRPDFGASWAGQPHTSLLALSRMDRRQSRAIVDQFVEPNELPESVLADIIAKTDGVPLFIEEFTRVLLESSNNISNDKSETGQQSYASVGVPATLQDSLMARLDRLAVGKPIAQVAAALGREFSHELIATVCEQESSEIEVALDELTDLGLVRRRGFGEQASYVFKHALVQDVAYQSLLRSARQTLHCRIACVLTDQFPDTARLQPEIVARHFSEGGQPNQAMTYWQQAGERAFTRAAHAEAIGHYSQALGLLDSIDEAEQRATAEIALNLGLAASMRVVDRLDEALQALGRAEAAAQAFDRPAELAEVHYLKGNIYFPLGQLEECLQSHELSRDFARRVGLLEKEARALGGMGDAYYQRGRLITAGEHYSSCIGLCQNHGFEQIEVAYLPMRGITRMYELRFREGIEDARSASAHAREIHNLRAEIISLQVISYLLSDMDEFDEAEKSSQRAIELCRRLGSGNLGASAQAHYGKLLGQLGRRQEATRILREAYASSKESGLNFLGPSILGYLAVTTDDPEERSQALREGERLLLEKSVSHNYLRFYRFAMDASLETGNWSETERYASAMETYAHAEPLPWADLLVERGRALAAYGRGDRSATTVETLTRVREHARSHNFTSAIHALDAALSEKL